MRRQLTDVLVAAIVAVLTISGLAPSPVRGPSLMALAAPGPGPTSTAPSAPQAVAAASMFSGTLYFTRTAGCTQTTATSRPANVFRASFTYIVGSKFTLMTPDIVTCTTTSVDGIVMAPDGNLLVGGNDKGVFKINPQTGALSTIRTPVQASHLMLDPTGTQLWVSGVPGQPASVPIAANTAPAAHALIGDDPQITTIAWDNAGHAYYTSSGWTGGSPGNGAFFGTIDFATWTTKRIMQLPAAHGMTFDPYTGDLILMGWDHITQISVAAAPEIVSDLQFNIGNQGTVFDQGTVDGRGHLFAACNCGSMLFIDYSVSRKVADPANFKAVRSMVSYLDDIAPLVGPGAAATQNPDVIEEQGRIRIILPAAILFDFDRFNLPPSAETALAWAKSSIIDKYPRAHLIVEGHTDDRGSAEYNLKLGAERAQSVAEWLKRHGISASLIETHSYGKTRPRYVPETTDENRTRNRRVEIVVVK